MNPIQLTNNNPIEGNLLRALLPELLGEVSSHLAKEHLGNLASVCQFFNTPEISNIIWKNLAQEQLPAGYLHLPSLILKEQFKSYHELMKEKVNLVLKNANRTAQTSYFEESNIFSEELVLLLKDKEIALKDKYAAIKSNVNLCYLTHRLAIFLDINKDLKDGLEALNLVLELVNINTSIMKSLVTLLIINQNEELLKKIIDAGFDLCAYKQGILVRLQQFANNGRITFSSEFFEKAAAYAAEKLANKN